MFAIDFTKPWLYKDVIYFNQGNLATNNILRCKLITGGDITLEGYIASVTFKTLSHAEINTSANIVDKANCVIDVKFPSNSLEVGVNELEVLLNKGDGNDKVVVQSPKIKYEVWQGLTTGNGIQGDNNYPILIDLMSEVRNTVRIANNASATADASLKQAARMIEEVDNTLIKVNNTIEETNNAKDEALEAVKDANRAIAAGTQDLEIKAAREDAEGVTHDTLALRLKSDLKIGSKSLKQEVLDLAGLKESQDMSYETNKGYLVCKETKNGTIKDLKLSGRTIKNLIGVNGKSSFTLNNSIKSKQYALSEIIKANTTMYFRVNITTKKAPLHGLRVALKNVDGSYSYYDGTKGVYNQSFKITHDKDINSIGLYIPNAEFESTPDANITYEKFQVTLAESYDYFEGIASVGAGVDKIEVSSIKSDGNLFDGKLLLGTLSGVTGEEASASDKVRSAYIELLEDGDHSWYIEDNPGGFLFSYDANKKFLDADINLSSLTTKRFTGVRYVRFRLNTTNDNIKIVLNKGAQPIPYQPYRQDKKPLLFKDVDGNWKPIKELRSCPECYDSVELNNDGKYYYHVRTEKKLYALGDENNTKVITDKTNTISKLAEEKVFEVTPLFLKAYEGETTFLCGSGVINAPTELKITSYITNLVLLNQQRISLIEQEMFNMFKQVLSGDMYSLAEKLYPEDFIEEKYIATLIPEL